MAAPLDEPLIAGQHGIHGRRQGGQLVEGLLLAPNPDPNPNPIPSPNANQLRYYDRITGAITAFEALGGNLGETSAIKKAMGTFFSTQEDSPYSELKGAGFLLAVAFKIDTKIPPDKIPAVKDYKAMMKDLEGLKGVNVKKPEAAQAAGWTASRTLPESGSFGPSAVAGKKNGILDACNYGLQFLEAAPFRHRSLLLLFVIFLNVTKR